MDGLTGFVEVNLGPGSLVFGAYANGFFAGNEEVGTFCPLMYMSIYIYLFIYLNKYIYIYIYTLRVVTSSSAKSQ